MERPPLESFFKSPIQKEDIEDEVKIKIRHGKDGKNGRDGLDGKDGKDGRDGKDGETGSRGERGDRGFTGEKGEPGKDGADGKDAIAEPIEITPKEIVEKINKSRGEKIKRSKIEGFDELEGRFKGLGNQVQNIASLGGSRLTNIQSNGVNIGQVDTINFTNGTVAVPTGNNGTTINYTAPSGTGGSFQGLQEKSTTSPNGVTQSFAFAHTPALIVWNGAIQALTDDYTVSGNTITFTASAGTPLTGDKVINIYA